MPNQNSKPILCLDFDGTIHSYSSGWREATEIPDLPVPGALRWIWTASQHFSITIYSSRSGEPDGIEAMKRWFRLQVGAELLVRGWEPWRDSVGECIELYMERLSFPAAKPPAFLTIDDRAIEFDGHWDWLDPEQLLKFKPWNKRDEREAKEKA